MRPCTRVLGKAQCRNGYAFTLLELLVVVAIVALLAAMLLPAIQGAREKGKLAYCVGQLRTLSQALQLYLQDSAGTMPCLYLHPNPPNYSDPNPYSPSPESTGVDGCWANLGGACDESWYWYELVPYIHDSGFDRATLADSGANLPAFEVQFKNSCPNRGMVEPGRWSNGAYGINYHLCGFVNRATPSGGLTNKPSTKLSAISRSSECFSFADSWVMSISHNGYLDAACYGMQGVGVSIDFWTGKGRHQGKINIAYMDGHVETYHGRGEWTVDPATRRAHKPGGQDLWQPYAGELDPVYSDNNPYFYDFNQTFWYGR